MDLNCVPVSVEPMLAELLACLGLSLLVFLRTTPCPGILGAVTPAGLLLVSTWLLLGSAHGELVALSEVQLDNIVEKG